MRQAAALLALLVALAGGVRARRLEHDFEFDDDTSGENSGATRPRRYVYDPRNPLCAPLECGAREACVLRDAFTALCANKRDILRRGDSLVAASSEPWGAGEDDFYDIDADNKPERCVGCEGSAGGGFVCGSDNRTYSSLCRLDLHNCVRRRASPVRRRPAGRPASPAGRPASPAGRPASPAGRPVRLACRGFCPCPEKPRRNNNHWSRRRIAQGNARCSLNKMADRLVDWFSVLQAGAPPPAHHGFPAGCKPEVRWMFTHLDTDGDGLLSANNLYALRHDEREQCLRPFLASCAGGGAGGGGGVRGGDGAGGGDGARGGDGAVSRAGWCACLRGGARPCTALSREHASAPGGYVPACSRGGYFLPRQCDAARGECWCVTPHGAELPRTRGRAGDVACYTPGDKTVQQLEFGDGVETNEVTLEADRGVDAAGGARGVDAAPDDDEDAAGSGDTELHF